jgi:hypothetical protein
MGSTEYKILWITLCNKFENLGERKHFPKTLSTKINTLEKSSEYPISV